MKLPWKNRNLPIQMTEITRKLINAIPILFSGVNDWAMAVDLR